MSSMTLATEEVYKEGLTLKALMAMIFSSVIMMPALLWVYLATGVGIGPIAAAYATMLIFGELGKLLMSPLNEHELATIRWGASMAASYTGGFLFSIYMRKSPITHQYGIADKIPVWVVPPETSEALINRIIWHPDWLLPIGIGYLTFFISLVGTIGISYITRELFIEVEKLPFPTGALAAEIAKALSKEAGGERYKIFAIVTTLMAMFEAARSLAPALGMVLFGRPIILIPPLHWDFTQQIELIIPGATIGFTTNFMIMSLGFIIPDKVIIWSIIGMIFAYIVMPPIFVALRYGPYADWRPGKPGVMLIPGTIEGSWYQPLLNIWLSIVIGMAVAGAIIPFITSFKQFKESLKSFLKLSSSEAKTYGVIPGKTAFIMFLASSITLSILAYMLTPRGIAFLIGVFAVNVGISFLNNIIAGRGIGLAAMAPIIPYANEVVLWLTTSPQDIEVWFNPFFAQLGGADLCIGYKAAELTRTKPMSITKAHIIGLLMTNLVGLVIAAMFWNVYDIPSRFLPAPTYPADALMRCLFITRQFMFLKPELIVMSFIIGTLIIVAPMIPVIGPILEPVTGISVVFGLINGFNDMPSNITVLFMGWIIKKLIERKMGREWASRNMITIAAGIWTGGSLVISLSTALRFAREAVAPEVF